MGRYLTLFSFLLAPSYFHAAEPLHQRIDEIIQAKIKGPVSPQSEDAEFLRRIYLDFAGRIPSASETRQFLSNKNPDKRVKLIDRLLASPAYAVRMQEQFNIMLMERLGEHKLWNQYLQRSFEQNKPWDKLVREILAGSNQPPAQGSAFFLAKRLENYGQNPVDYSGLTRDLARLFLGKDIRCAECHDHLYIGDYKQKDFQGFFLFTKNVSKSRNRDVPGVEEKPTTKKLEFASVFDGKQMATGPLVPGYKEISLPKLKKGEEYKVKPDRRKRTPGVLKFSLLEKLAETIPNPDNQSFNQNIVNRLWFLMMGNGLVYPLDLHHSDNPPSHPKLLRLLAKEFVAHKYDVKWMLRELALTKTYQRSSRLPGGIKKVDPKEYRTGLERRLSPEQLLRSFLEATGESKVKGGTTFDKGRPLFLKAFSYPPRNPEDKFNPTLKAALFLLNNDKVLSWLDPKPGNLTDRLQKIKSAPQVAEELYLAVLSRNPSRQEINVVTSYLEKQKSRRNAAIRNLTWALLASTEFYVNH